MTVPEGREIGCLLLTMCIARPSSAIRAPSDPMHKHNLRGTFRDNLGSRTCHLPHQLRTMTAFSIPLNRFHGAKLLLNHKTITLYPPFLVSLTSWVEKVQPSDSLQTSLPCSIGPKKLVSIDLTSMTYKPPTNERGISCSRKGTLLWGGTIGNQFPAQMYVDKSYLCSVLQLVHL